MFTYVFLITLISALIAFRTIKRIVNKFLSFANLSLKSEASLKDEAKLIVQWIALYSLCNLIIQIFVTSDFIYNKLAVFSQGIIFYLLLRNNPLKLLVLTNSKHQ